jgi:hypothetical protein
MAQMPRLPKELTKCCSKRWTGLLPEARSKTWRWWWRWCAWTRAKPPLGALRALVVLWWLGARSGDDGAESARRPHASMAAGANEMSSSQAGAVAEEGRRLAAGPGLVLLAAAGSAVGTLPSADRCRDGGAEAGRGDGDDGVARRFADVDEEGGVGGRLPPPAFRLLLLDGCRGGLCGGGLVPMCPLLLL